MLKLTRLLHFHQQDRTDLLDYYERALFNQMLGEQDPHSAHGFNIYYTGLSPGAFKQQPLNYFPHADPDVYATDYDDFTCDNATGMETQAKFADTIYSRDERGIVVNLFIASELTCADRGVTLRQATASRTSRPPASRSPRGWRDDDPGPRPGLDGAAAPTARLNGQPIRVTARAGGWLAVDRLWQRGDVLEVTLPMRLALEPAPDDRTVQRRRPGPIVLSGAYGTDKPTTMPRLRAGWLTRAGR